MNNLIFEQIGEIAKKYKVIHVTGSLDYKKAKELRDGLSESLKNNYEVLDYSMEMPRLLSGASVVVSRAGATSIFEIAALNKKAIIIPISKRVTVHQEINAEFVKDLGIATVLPSDVKGVELKRCLYKILEEKKPSKMQAIHFSKSSEYIANLICEFIEYFEVLKNKKMFFIGIGGVSMKLLAELLRQKGIVVRGSDIKTGGHSASNINISYDAVVYSSAASVDSAAKVEHQKADKLNIKILKRSQMIGAIMKGHRGISVSGMHGKTTVASLISSILEKADYDPSYLVGADTIGRSHAFRNGGGIDFVSEACEYDGSFLDFPTKLAVITNIEEEHLDYFKGGIKEIIKTFEKFILQIHRGGLLVYCLDDERVSGLVERNLEILKDKRITVLSYGFHKKADAVISKYSVNNFQSNFMINHLEFSSSKIGKHFALNTCASYLVAKFLSVDDSIIRQSIQEFEGASRRFELLGVKDGVVFYDDYAHHPTEIKATFEALNEAFESSRKFIIFEPHQQKRFNDFYPQFKTVFKNSKVDFIGLLPVKHIEGRDVAPTKTSKDLSEELSGKVSYLNDYETAKNFLGNNIKKGDIVVTMGATDVYKIAEELLHVEKKVKI